MTCGISRLLQFFFSSRFCFVGPADNIISMVVVNLWFQNMLANWNYLFPPSLQVISIAFSNSWFWNMLMQLKLPHFFFSLRVMWPSSYKTCRKLQMTWTSNRQPEVYDNKREHHLNQNFCYILQVFVLVVLKKICLRILNIKLDKQASIMGVHQCIFPCIIVLLDIMTNIALLLSFFHLRFLSVMSNEFYVASLNI